MGTEIERKYLVKLEAWQPPVNGNEIRQGFIYGKNRVVTRVRIKNNKAFLTLKGETEQITRREFEYEIPKPDAEILLEEFCEKPLIEKTRYVVDHGGKVWEVDKFYGDNAGLMIAEIELESEDETFELPEWAGKEVSEDPRYYNSNLAKDPYCKWKESHT